MKGSLRRLRPFIQGNSDLFRWLRPRWRFTGVKAPLSAKENPVPFKGKASPYLVLCLQQVNKRGGVQSWPWDSPRDVVLADVSGLALGIGETVRLDEGSSSFIFPLLGFSF